MDVAILSNALVLNGMVLTDSLPFMTDLRADFWEGDATHFSAKKKGFFSEKGGGNSVNEGLGWDLRRKGNSVKRSGPFSEPPDSAN